MKAISILQSKKTAGTFSLLVAAFMLFAAAASAQKTYTVSLISPTSGSIIAKGQMYTIQFKVTNTGMMAMAVMDTIMAEVDINGSMAMMGGTMLTTPINPGASQTFQITNFSYSSFTVDNNNSNMCVNVTIPHNTNSGTSQNCMPIKLRLSPTAVGQVVGETLVNVFPNPANSFISVKAAQQVEGTVRLYDMSGKVIAQLQLNGNNQTIETSSFPGGIYFYKLADKQGVVLQTGKIAISH